MGPIYTIERPSPPVDGSPVHIKSFGTLSGLMVGIGRGNNRKGDPVWPVYLVVDDDELMRDLMRLVLEAEQHVVEVVDSGEKGLEWLHREPFELMITDMALIDMDGLEVIQEVRKTYPEIKVVAITGWGDMAEQKLFPLVRAMGVEHTFTKPFMIQEFLRGIDELLGTTSRVFVK